jgi:hypothetical protein
MSAATGAALQARNSAKHARALQFLGDRWLLHPANRVR